MEMEDGLGGFRHSTIDNPGDIVLFSILLMTETRGIFRSDNKF
jgi:hypothetical protein